MGRSEMVEIKHTTRQNIFLGNINSRHALLRVCGSDCRVESNSSLKRRRKQLGSFSWLEKRGLG